MESPSQELIPSSSVAPSSSVTPSSSSATKRRRAITDADRQRVRKRNKDHPAQQADLAAWFYQETGHQLTQGQISTVLSSKYEYLDFLDKKKDKKQLVTKRASKGDWPDLEAALFEWQQRMQKKKAVITGEILKAQAAKLWASLPQYEGKEAPKFSNGWLEGFQWRFNLREYVQHGEASSAAINTPDSQEQMQVVRDLSKEYGPKDTYNMDETGLFWKLTPERTLATEAGSGGKKSKDRLTLAFTCNGVGDKEDVWVIGRSKNPRCFKNINQRLLRIQYRYNKSKWMTGMIMEEYLRWFNNKMYSQGRKVLLLLDNFSGHELGVQLIGGKQGLSNVRIEWLPPNTTSHWQPLDQGIIASFKLQYRRLWISYMLRQYESDKDPNQTVTLLKAIQWTRVAWNDTVTKECIKKCFWKSTVFKKPANQEVIAREDSEQEQRAELQVQITALPGIIDPLLIDEFIEPSQEVIEDDDEDIFASVVERYSAEKEGEEEPIEEGDIEVEKVPIREAIRALETLKLWEIQQENGEISALQTLEQIGRRIQQNKLQSIKQTTLHSFFQRN
jgi:DDE superfamily endonuclease/Tc5 transposase DNA-binding domain/Fission yeast centromere protein N-terminal domain